MAQANAATSIFGGAATGAGVGAATGTPIGIAAGAVIGAGAGLIGYLIESGHEDAANEIIKKAREGYGKLDDSAIQAAAAQVLGPTHLAQIKANPRYREIQDDSLAQMSQLSRSGLSLSDRANLSDSMDSAGQEDKHAREAVLSSFAQRGMGGSQNELAAALSSQQSGANRASENARHIAGDAQDRALKAISESSQMAGNLESTDYNRQADAAKSQDAVDKFNNTNQYNRANDAYGRQLATMDRNYGMAGDQAGQERAAGQRQGQVVAGVGNALGKTIERASAAGGGGTKPAPDAPGGSGGDGGHQLGSYTDTNGDYNIDVGQPGFGSDAPKLPNAGTTQDDPW